MEQVAISDGEFGKFKSLIYELAGISLSDAKKALVVSRLSKRLRTLNLSSFGDYYKLVSSGQHSGELQMMVDLLTTNETYFFREAAHLDFIAKEAKAKKSWKEPFKVWSAASSSGEEAYSVSMMLNDVLGEAPYEIIGTDISTRVLEMARQGVYSSMRTSHIPKSFLLKYCLKGVRSQEGSLAVRPEIKKPVSFKQLNLLGDWAGVGVFDVILLRNVMIYFDNPTKQKLVSRLINYIKPGGHLIIGLSESLNGISHNLKVVSPSVYKKG